MSAGAGGGSGPAAGRDGPGPDPDAGFGGADLHFHSTASDGVESPESLAALAAAAGLSVAVLTDHDAVHGVQAFVAAARGTGLVAAGGAELSVDEAGQDVHLLGLFVDPDEPLLTSRLAELREVRERRAERMVERLAALGIALDLERLRAEVGDGAFGRPHVARALVAVGAVASVEEAFERYLADGAPAFVPKAKWSLGEAIASVRAAGGLAILAHPVWYADVTGLLRKGLGLGLDGVEVFHPDNEGREEELLAEAETLGLLASGGSDFHSPAYGCPVGGRRVGRPLWERLAEAAVARRRDAGRPALDLAPR
ncbi:MAG TPA: PHP domain-containing protein [Thermoanaerobaculia bacterium]|nr:PHP domain-containing protein [Thermoanaerobaculia bacterium]